MQLADIAEILSAKVLIGDELLHKKVRFVFCCDLLSDVLAFSCEEGTLLLTGLTNIQVIHTANMINAVGVIFVRGKIPPSEVIEAARKMGIPLLTTGKLMFETCGVLYTKGLGGVR